MQLLLAQHRIAQTSVRLWAAAMTDGDPPGDVRLTLQPGDQALVLPATGWRRVMAGGSISRAAQLVFVQVLPIGGLAAGSAYTVSAPGLPGATARLSTLPAALPGEGERPFTVLLASCFHQINDQEGLLGRAVEQLPQIFQPDVKILCGDQVYLDTPFSKDFPNDRRWLGESFLQKYVSTFFQRPGFADLLRSGASYFTSDDHEFWNNFPNWAPLSSNTWTEGGRRQWTEVAADLYCDFQTDDRATAGHPRRFEAGPLSFFLADTRFLRQEGDDRFMDEADLQELVAWVQGLSGPGVLVVTQPVLDTQASWLNRRVKDRCLSDYRQYAPLCQALLAARHSVLVLTGDVHFGRVAVCELQGGDRPVRLVEVISSPATLVLAAVGGKAWDAPASFPAFGPGPRRPVTTLYKAAEDQFATLHFYQRAGHIEVRVRYWFQRALQFGATQMYPVSPIQLS